MMSIKLLHKYSSGLTTRHDRSRSDFMTWPMREPRFSNFGIGEDATTPKGNDWAIILEGEESIQKRVMIVVDHTSEAKVAMLWALSHVVQKGDKVTLLHVIPSSNQGGGMHEGCFQIEPKIHDLTNSMKASCLSHIPEVDLEVVITKGDKGPTIVDQAKKLMASILIIGQRKPSILKRMLQRYSSDAWVEYCIQNVECLTYAVRKKSKSSGGYLINSQSQKNFWLLA